MPLRRLRPSSLRPSSFRAWVSLRMIALAIATAVFVSFGMWYRYELWYEGNEARLPPELRTEVRTLEQDPTANARRLGEIYVQYYSEPTARDDLLVFFGLLLAVTPFIVMFGLWSAKRLSQSVTHVTRAARSVAEGDFSVRARAMPGTPIEIQQLVRDFNAMADRLQKYERELRDSSAAIAHEIRTPLTGVTGRLQGIADGVFPCDLEQVGMAIVQLEQLNRLVSDLRIYSLALAGQLQLHPDRFALRELVDERIRWAAPQLAAQAMQAVNGLPADLAVTADRDRIGQVITALIDNALRYAAEGGVIEFRCEQAGPLLTLRMLDRGPGMPAADLPRLFDRFWRAEPSRARHAGGSGLGLAIAAAISEAHQGAIEAANRPDGGLEIRLTLPQDGPRPLQAG